MSQSDDLEKTIQELKSMAAIYERLGQSERAQQLENLAAHLQMRAGKVRKLKLADRIMDEKTDAV